MKYKQLLKPLILFLFCITVFCFIIFFAFRIQYLVYFNRHPLNFSKSTWNTSNGEIRFSIEEKVIYEGEYFNGEEYEHYFSLSHADGELHHNEKKYGFYAKFNVEEKTLVLISREALDDKDLQQKRLEQLESNYVLAVFEVKCKSKSHFTATVLTSSFFEVGKTFDFFKNQNQK